MLDLTVAKDWQALEDYIKRLASEQIQALSKNNKPRLGDPAEVAASRARR